MNPVRGNQGAGRVVKNKKGSRKQGKCLGAGSTKIWKIKQGAAKKLKNGAKSKKKIKNKQGEQGECRRVQGA